MDNPYLSLTRELNRDRLRVLLSSGQAVVVHRLAVMSKDGDWIVREDESWAEVWPDIQREVDGLSLIDAHRLITSRAEGVLPFEPVQEAAP